MRLGKQIVLGATLLAVFSLRAGAVTKVTLPQNSDPTGFLQPTPVNNPGFIGAQVYRIDASTPVDTPVMLVVGSGMLYGIDCSSGNTAAFALAFDTSTGSGIVANGSTSGMPYISPAVFTPGLGSQTTTSGLGHWDVSATPAQFSNGLAIITHGNAAVPNCVVRARLNNGNNPGP